MTADRTMDLNLIEGFLHGDAEAHAQIRAWVQRVVRLRAWGLRSDEDLTQDILLHLLSNLGTGRFEGRSSLQTYVERMAKYRCIDALRREKRHRHLPLEESGEPEPRHNDNPLRRATASEETRLAFAVLERLPELCRSLLKRLLAEDASYAELARENDVAPGTIKSRVARCRARANELRAAMGGPR